MKYSFKLFDPETNKTIVYKEESDWEDESLMLYQWLEGNYSCDCNRRLFMYGTDDFECGEEVKLLEIIREDDSKVDFNIDDY